MTKLIWAVAVFLVVGGLAYHFAALEIFNLLVPKDADSRLVARDVSYGGDVRQKLDVYAPKQDAGALPVIVFVHGGSWQSGNKNAYEFVGRALAAQGFVTMVISYRLHPKDKYPAFIEDAALALKWAAENATLYGGDGAKLFALGHSAGAYNIAMAVLDLRYTPIVPKLRGVVALAGPFDFVPLDSPASIAVFGHLADLPPTQPINHVRADVPPFLLLHGRDDVTVRIKNSEALQRGLESVGAEVHLKIYDNMAHVDIMLALSRAMRGNAPVLEDAVAFIKDRSE
jgi:acetyl esterase/lipase